MHEEPVFVQPPILNIHTKQDMTVARTNSTLHLIMDCEIVEVTMMGREKTMVCSF